MNKSQPQAHQINDNNKKPVISDNKPKAAKPAEVTKKKPSDTDKSCCS